MRLGMGMPEPLHPQTISFVIRGNTYGLLRMPNQVLEQLDPLLEPLLQKASSSFFHFLFGNLSCVFQHTDYLLEKTWQTAGNLQSWQRGLYLNASR